MAPKSKAAPATPAPVNPYEWHDNAMKGVRGPIHDGEPQTGWYRYRKLTSAKGVLPKTYTFLPVAYWKDTVTGAQRCHVDGREMENLRALEMWPYASVYPISEEVYEAYMTTGKWPEHNDALKQQELSNAAPEEDSLEDIRSRIDAMRAEANRLIAKGPAKTQAEADAAADVAVKLGELYAFADKRRKEEKQPSIDEGRRIDNMWNPVRDNALIYTDLKQKVVNPFLAAENKRKEDEARAAENERLAKIAAAETAKPADKVLTNEAVYTPPPKFEPAKAGSGKTVSQRAVKTMQIDDFDKALLHFKDHPKVRELIQDLANTMARTNMPVPGCTILTDGKAV